MHLEVHLKQSYNKNAQDNSRGCTLLLDPTHLCWLQTCFHELSEDFLKC